MGPSFGFGFAFGCLPRTPVGRTPRPAGAKPAIAKSPKYSIGSETSSSFGAASIAKCLGTSLPEQIAKSCFL